MALEHEPGAALRQAPVRRPGVGRVQTEVGVGVGVLLFDLAGFGMIQTRLGVQRGGQLRASQRDRCPGFTVRVHGHRREVRRGEPGPHPFPVVKHPQPVRLRLGAVKVRPEQRNREIRDEPPDPSLEIPAPRERRARGPGSRATSPPFLVAVRAVRGAGVAEEPGKLGNLQTRHRLVQRTRLEPSENYEPQQEPSHDASARGAAQHLTRRDVTDHRPQEPRHGDGGRERGQEGFGLRLGVPGFDIGALRHRAVPLQYGRVRAPRGFAEHRAEQG